MAHALHEMADERIESVELSPSERCDLLADERRRLTVEALADEPGPTSLDDLATAVADRTEGGEPSGDGCERIAVSLHHVHLPKLSAAGLLDYDPEANRVEH